MKKKNVLLCIVVLALIAVLAITLSACAKVSLTLNFIVDGKVYATVETDGQETIRMPADPKKPNATFEGWYWDEGTWTRPFTANSLLQTPLTSNASVYAKFRTEEEPVDTELRLEGFTLIETEELGKAYYISLPNSQLIFDVAAAVKIDNRATWSLSVDLYGNHTIASKRVDLEVGDNIYYILVQNQYGKSEQYILLMRRRPIYTVTFDTGAGTYCLPQMVEEREYATAPTTTRVGYTFFCWDYDFDKPIVKNTVVTAIWTVNSYTITYNANGGKCVSSQKVTYDHSIELATPTRDGYTFVGWLLDGQPFDENRYEQKWTIAKDITLVAQWSAKSYDIYYNLGCDVSNNNPTTYTVGEEITLNSVSRTGYTFNGWREGNNFYPASELPIQIDLGVGNKTFVADWTAKTYTITLNSDGGDCPESELTVAYDEYVSLPSCTKLAYTFLGWYYQEKRIDNGTWKIADDVTLTAHWKANSDTHYTVNHYTENLTDEGYTLRLSEDLQGTTDSVVYPAVQAFDGFSAPSVEELKILPDGSAVLDYYYSRNSYTITFAMNGGNEISPITQKYESTITIPETGVRDGFTFGGWFADVALSEEFADTTMQATDKTVYAWWQEETKPIDLNFSCGYTSASIYGYKGSDTTLRIPSYIGNLPVTYISSCSESNLTKVFVPDTVTSISSGAFRYCSALEEITLPFVGESENGQKEASVFGHIFGYKKYSDYFGSIDGVVYQFSNYPKPEYYYYYIPKTIRKVTVTKQIEMPSYAFFHCDFIEHIIIPEDTTSLGSFVFSDCANLSTLNSEEEGTFAIPQGITIIPSSGFDGCALVEKVTLGNITSMGNCAFQGCVRLKSFNSENPNEINVPKGVTTFDYFAFKGASLITKVIVPDTVTSIGEGAFRDCSALEEITLPFVGARENVKNNDGAVFGYIFGFDTKYNSNCVSQSNYYYYIPKTIRKVTITKQTEIPAHAFKNCDFIEHITIPEDATSIGVYAFYNCKNLSSLNSETAGTFAIPQGVAEISNYCFDGCSLLEKVTMGSTTSIGSYAFRNCAQLTSFNTENVNEINIPAGTTKIDTSAFQGATLITKVIVPDTVTSIGDGAFKDCAAIVEITLPFVGKSENSTEYATVFGYVFGYATSSSSNGVNQYYYNKYYYYYYIPKTIIKVTITKQAEIPAYAFKNCDFIEHITIPEDATGIGAQAFYNCSKLSTLNSETAGTFAIPQNVAVISDNCFYQCALLQTATIGNIESIGINAFYNCSSLTSFNTENVNEINIPASTTKIDTSAFQGASLITRVIVSDTVMSVGDGAFKDCSALEEIILPFVGKSETSTKYATVFGYIFGYTNSSSSNSVNQCYYDKNYYYYIPKTIRNVTITKQTEIPAYAFKNCDFIEHITIPQGATSIGTNAFYNCSKLSTLNSETAGTFAIPQGVTTIPDSCFYNCSLLTNVNVLNNITIGTNAFYGTGISKQLGLVYIGNYLYKYNGTMPTDYILSVRKGTTDIYADALKDCTGLKKVILPEGFKAIRSGAFSGCTNLSEIVFSETLETIESQAFNKCSKLSTLTIPNSVTSIASSAFSGCSGLTELTLPFVGKSSETWGTFSSIFGTVPSSLKTVTITGNGTLASSAFSGCSYLTSITFTGTVDGVGASAFKGCSSLQTISLPTVTTLGENAFQNCSKLGTISIPAVTEIGAYAFDGCSLLTTVDFGQESPLTSIGTYAFRNCKALQSITIPSGVTAIADNTFYGCNHLEEITLSENTESIGVGAFQNCTALTEINIPASVVTIMREAFKGCKTLQTITIQGAGLRTIDAYAFQNCAALESIYLKTSVQTIGEYAFDGCTALQIYCETEQIPDGWDFNWNPDELPVTWNHKEN